MGRVGLLCGGSRQLHLLLVLHRRHSALLPPVHRLWEAGIAVHELGRKLVLASCQVWPARMDIVCDVGVLRKISASEHQPCAAPVAKHGLVLIMAEISQRVEPHLQGPCTQVRIQDRPSRPCQLLTRAQHAPSVMMCPCCMKGRSQGCLARWHTAAQTPARPTSVTVILWPTRQHQDTKAGHYLRLGRVVLPMGVHPVLESSARSSLQPSTQFRQIVPGCSQTQVFGSLARACRTDAPQHPPPLLQGAGRGRYGRDGSASRRTPPGPSMLRTAAGPQVC